MKQFLHASVRKCCALTLIVLSANVTSFGQLGGSTATWEIGATLGPSNFLGDLGGTQGKGTTFLKDNNFAMTKLAFGLYAAYSPRPLLNFRLALNFGTLEGDDAIIKGKGGLEEARKIRNSNFRSKLTELMLLAEVYPTVFIENEPDDVWLKLRPYGMIGVGAFKFNPQGQHPTTHEWVDLKPLRTEGQGLIPGREEYKLTQLNIPMGVGVKYFLTETFHVSLEVLHRKTFTDYIDDVSTNYVDDAIFYANMPGPQATLAATMANKSGANTPTRFNPGDKRGTPTNNDAYYSFNIKVGFRFVSDRYGNSTRCPIIF
ncbi:MAG: outer membrane beta-barrel protein [Niastella sp.]|nr:outer membrane beta-barrel protein [Niastella sp.]PZR28296.1 MAG: hypothetical protein DI538_24975 [Azospira oryzae]